MDAHRGPLYGWLREVIEDVRERVRQVLIQRYGFDTDEAHIAHEVADLLGHSHALVEDIERRVHVRVSIQSKQQATQSALAVVSGEG